MFRRIVAWLVAAQGAPRNSSNTAAVSCGASCGVADAWDQAAQGA
jgi:hypothetical protein